MKPGIHMVIPAAGFSRRHRQNKLLLKVDGLTVIERTVSTFLTLPLDIVVVVGHRKERVRAVIEERFGSDVEIVENPDFKTGMASSLKAGIRASGADCPCFGFCNGDKPFISRDTVSSLLQLLEQRAPAILVPTFHGTIGHPTFFSASLKHELLALTGETGGREIIKRHPEQTLFFAVEDEGVVLDMDRYLAKNNV